MYLLWSSLIGVAIAAGYFVALMAISKTLPKDTRRYTLSQLLIATTALAFILGFVVWYARQ